MAKKKKPKFYVVWEGREPGVYSTWADCQKQINGYQGARYKSFPTKLAAEEAFHADSRDFIGKNAPKKIIPSIFDLPPDQLPSKVPIWDSISVDAACSGNPGQLEYQGVDTKTGIRLFHWGPYPKGTVNLGEFLALVHGLAYLQKLGKLDKPIYTDSKTAMAWVRDKTVRTNLARTRVTERLFGLVDRGLYWIKNNKFKNPILKWETEIWGEIPADFGRK